MDMYETASDVYFSARDQLNPALDSGTRAALDSFHYQQIAYKVYFIKLLLANFKTILRDHKSPGL